MNNQPIRRLRELDHADHKNYYHIEEELLGVVLFFSIFHYLLWAETMISSCSDGVELRNLSAESFGGNGGGRRGGGGRGR